MVYFEKDYRSAEPSSPSLILLYLIGHQKSIDNVKRSQIKQSKFRVLKNIGDAAEFVSNKIIKTAKDV
jgi:hypothetical protein